MRLCLYLKQARFGVVRVNGGRHWSLTESSGDASGARRLSGAASLRRLLLVLDWGFDYEDEEKDENDAATTLRLIKCKPKQPATPPLATVAKCHCAPAMEGG